MYMKKIRINFANSLLYQIFMKRFLVIDLAELIACCITFISSSKIKYIF